MAEDVLRVEHLGKHYAALTAVDDLSFNVGAGEIVGLLGPNGAGKTTTISMLLGLLAPDTGRVVIDGHDLGRARAKALAAANFAAVYAPLPGNLSVVQNLRFFGRIYGVDGLDRRIGTLLDQFDLVALRNTRCGLLSSGEQTRAALAKALLNAPRLLLLDEPTASLDPATARDLRELIRDVAKRDAMAVLWTSHNMPEVEAVCDRVLFLSHGRVLLEGDPRRLPEIWGSASLEELFIRVAREPLSLGNAS
ncbi:MAG TPA: ABC transporter ATP-binding protein [Nevskiaceae bacterium]|nr:ABC transporter ATP-binding protein [Nevskiaceae bacterium]